MPILGVLAAGGTAPGAPTIGTAVAGDGSATVAFTAPTWTGKGSGTVTYTATSSPGSFTGTATSSPITVSGLTNGTGYTFTVKATTSYGVTGPSSAASNSITPAASGNFYSLASYTVPSDTGSAVSFTSIDQTYKDLVLIISAGTTYGGSGGGTAGKLYFNNDTTAKYNNAYIIGNGNGGTTSVQTGNSINQTQLDFGANWAGNANKWGMSIWTISDYANTNKLKAFHQRNGSTLLAGGNGGNSNTGIVNGFYNSTNAISSIYFQMSTPYSDGNMAAGTTFTLFGVKG